MNLFKGGSGEGISKGHGVEAGRPGSWKVVLTCSHWGKRTSMGLGLSWAWDAEGRQVCARMPSGQFPSLCGRLLVSRELLLVLVLLRREAYQYTWPWRVALPCPTVVCVCVYACTRVCTCVCAHVCVHARNDPSWIPSLTFGRWSLASSAQAGGSAALRAAKTSFSGRQGPPYTAGACPQAQGASSWGANWVPQDSLEPIGGIETCVLLQRHGRQRDLG